MRRPAQLTLRFFLVVAVVTFVSVLVSSPGPNQNPYVSALSSLAVPQAFAKPTCNFKACGGSRHNEACNPVNTASQCTNYKGFCIIGNCT